MELDYSDNIIIKITKVKDSFGFSHWETDVQSETADVFLGGTSASFLGALDMASEYLYDEYQEGQWFKDNSNDT